MAFPNLLTSAVKALHQGVGNDLVEYRQRSDTGTLEEGLWTPGAWGAWAELPKPYVANHDATDDRETAPDGNRSRGRMRVFCSNVAALQATATPLRQGDELRARGRTWRVQSVSDYSERSAHVEIRALAQDA